MTQSITTASREDLDLLPGGISDSTLWIVKERQPIRDRTPKQAASEPTWVSDREWMVEVNGIEPMTPCLQSRCSPS